MKQFDYEESFTLIDIKLALGLATVIISGGLFAIEKVYKLKMTEMYTTTVVAVILYGIFSGILSLINYKHKNVKYTGYKGSKEKITIATWTSKYDPIYNVTIKFNDSNPITKQYQFKQFYDQLGYFNSDAFIKLIKNDIQKKSQ